jgi:MFS family permease
MIFVSRTVLYPLLPVIGDEFALSGAQQGAITSAYFLAYVLMQIPIGLSGDRYGLKRLLIITFTISALGLLTLGLLATSFPALLLSGALYGAGAGGFHPMAFSLTLGSVPETRKGSVSAIINAGSALGLVVGLSLAGPLFLATGSWRLPFLLSALPMLALAWLFQRYIRPLPQTGSDISSALHLLRDPNLLSLYLATFCSLYAFWTVVVWGPTYFLEERGIGLGLAGVFTAVVALGGIPGGLYLGRLSDRLGRKPVARSMMPLAALSVLALPLVRSELALIAVLILYGLMGKLAWEPIAVAWTGEHTAREMPGAMGAALALFGTIGMTSSVVAPLLAGWIRDGSGTLQGAFYAAAGVLLLGSLLLSVPGETLEAPEGSL